MKASLFTSLSRWIDNLTGLAQLPGPVRRRVRGSQMAEIQSASPHLMVGALIAICATLISMRDAPVFPILLWLSGLTGLLQILSFKRWLRARRSGHLKRLPSAGSKLLRRAVAKSFVGAVIWSLIGAITFASVDRAGDALTTGLVIGTVFVVSAYALSPVIQVALVFTVTTALTMLVSAVLFIEGINLMMFTLIVAIYGLAFPAYLAANSKRFVAQQAAELVSRESFVRVDRMLADFQESAMEWLWECDAKGRLIKGSDDLMVALSINDLDGTDTARLTERLKMAGATNQDAIQRLDEAMNLGQAFRLVEISLNKPSGEIVLSMTGKPITDERGYVTGYLGVCADVTDQRLAEAAIIDMARTDALTGVLNRSSFNQALDAAVRKLERHGTPMTLMFMDLDKFKLVNDTYGHHAGDELLREVVRRIKGHVRISDTVARLGGDEFAIILHDTLDPVHAAKLATRLIDSICEPCRVEQETLYVGASIGIAIAPLHGTRPEQLLRNADLALYRAKEDGRAVFRFFESQMDFRQRERRMLEQEMREALAEDAYEMNFQPIVNVRTGKVSSIEALLRWDHAIRGMVSPEEFIPIAEQSSLIVDIGKWTLVKACTTASHWPDDIMVAVNLSTMHFVRSDIVADVRHALNVSGIPASRLELEITEGLLAEHPDEISGKLRDLRELGVSIALDDFGTGYSSLSYLTKFPFNRLKIDRSFLADIDTNDKAKAILQAISALGENLGIHITVEGVETAEQIAFLRTIWCDQIQGYFYSRPLPPTELAGFLLKTAPFEVFRRLGVDDKQDLKEIA